MRRPVNHFASIPSVLRLANRFGWPRGRSSSGIPVAVMPFLICLLGTFAVDARADDSASDFIFYGGPEIALYAHTGKGNSTSTDITGPRFDPSMITVGDFQTDQILPDQRSREVVAAFLAGGTFGFLTPGLDVPGRPRLFLDLNVSSPAGTEVQLARSGDPERPAFPRNSSISGVQVAEKALIGTGTVITAQLQGPQIHAGLGVSFEIPLENEQLLRIKPAAVYSRTILDISALTIRGVRLNDDDGTNQTIDDYRVINVQDERTEVYHAAGPSLEIEYVPDIQWGPFTVSLYGRGHAAHIFNTLQTKMQQCNVAGGQPNECASWKYTQDAWTYRATFGVHLNWVPRPLW